MDSIIYEHDKIGWIAKRGEMVGYGKTQGKAKQDLEETERFFRITKQDSPKNGV